MVGYDLDFTIDCIINSRQSHHDFHLFEFSSFLLSLNAIGLLFLFFLNQWRRSLLVIRENAGLRLLTFQTREAPSAYYTVYGLHVSKFAPQYTPTELQSGFSRLVMNGQWHRAPHSDKSLPNDTEKEGRGRTIHQTSCAHQRLWEDHTLIMQCGASPVLYPS